jgi:hypothetical protein
MIALVLLQVFGDVVYYNPQSSGSSGYRDFSSPVSSWAQKITINHSFTGISASAVNLNLGAAYSGNATFDVFLNADDGGIPGSVVGVLGGGNWRDLSTGGASTAWVQSGAVSFSTRAAGDYWISVYTPDGFDPRFRWSYGDDLNQGQTALLNTDNNLWSYPQTNASLGAFVDTTAVPEPGTFILGAFAALVALGVWFFR